MPVVAGRAAVGTNHDDRARRRDDDNSRTTSTDAAAVRRGTHAGSTSAGGVGDIAETDEGARNQGGGEEIFHLDFLPDREAQHPLPTPDNRSVP